MMKASRRDFVIPFVGLKLGKHEFTFQINDSFFEELEYSPISKGDLKVELVLEKKEVMMLADFQVNGNITTNCDRCNTPVELPISGEMDIIYKFGEEDSGDENLIVIFPEEFEIDVHEIIYEMIVLALPIRILHEPGECDEEMWELVRKYTVNSSLDDTEEEEDDEEEDNLGFEDFDPNDPRWTINKN